MASTSANNKNNVMEVSLGGTASFNSVPYRNIDIFMKSEPRTLRVSWEWHCTIKHTATNKTYTETNVVECYRIYAQQYVRMQDGEYKWGTLLENQETDAYTTYYDFTVADEATAVRLSITPVSKSYTYIYKEEEKESLFFSINNNSVEFRKYDFSAKKPQTPPVPSVEMDGKNLKITANDVPIEADDLHVETAQVFFEVIAVDHNDHNKKLDTPIINSTSPKTILISNDVTDKIKDIPAGHYYRVRTVSQASSKDGSSQAYSEYCDAIAAPPSVPIITNINPITDSQIRVRFEIATGATDYRVELIDKNNIPKEYIIVKDKNNTSSDKYNARYFTLTELFTDSNLVTITKDVKVEGDDKQFATPIIPDIPGGEYYIRILATNESGNSDGSETIERSAIEFSIGSEPSAPTTWSNVNTAVIGEGEEIILNWIHNSEDNSVLKHSKLILTYQGKSSTVNLSSSGCNVELDNGLRVMAKAYNNAEDTVRYCTIQAISTNGIVSGSTIKWKVSTAGAKVNTLGEPVYGPYSIERSIELYEQPQLSLLIVNAETSNTGTVVSFPFNVKMAVNNTSNQTPVTYQLRIVADKTYKTIDDTGKESVTLANTQVYSKFIESNITDLEGVEITNSGKTVSVIVSAGDCDLLPMDYEGNIVSYSMYATVGMSSGLKAEASIKGFEVKYEDIPTPGGIVTVDKENLTATISPVAYASDGTRVLDNSYQFSIYRRETNGSFVKIGDTIPASGVVTDPHPALDYARYRIVARSTTTGYSSFIDLPSEYIGEYSIVIQWDETWSERYKDDPYAIPSDTNRKGSILKLPYNISISDTHGVDSVLVEYIGRERPVSYYGTQKKHTSSWSTEIPKDDVDTLYAIRRLAEWIGDVYVREPSGTGYWASISVNYSVTYSDLTIPVSFSITRVEGGQ